MVLRWASKKLSSRIAEAFKTECDLALLNDALGAPPTDPVLRKRIVAGLKKLNPLDIVRIADSMKRVEARTFVASCAERKIPPVLDLKGDGKHLSLLWVIGIGQVNGLYGVRVAFSNSATGKLYLCLERSIGIRKTNQRKRRRRAGR